MPWPWLAAAALAVALALALARTRSGPPAPVSLSQPRLSQVTISEGVESAPAFSRDGLRLAFVSEADGLRGIVVKRLDDGQERRVAGAGYDSLQPAFAPDGRTLAFVRARQAGARLEPGDVFGSHVDGDVWTVELETGRETRLLQNAFNPSYSPDGSQLAVDASWAGPRRLWVTDAHGRNPQQATSDASEAAAHLRPRWSPDGKRLVYQHLEHTRFDVHVVDLASQAATPLTSDPTLDIQPVFAPSGRFVYFSSHRGGGLNIWRLPLSPDGRPAGRLEQVTTGAGQDVEAAFADDGGRLAFAILRQNADLYRLPLEADATRAAGPPERIVSTTREDSRGAWSPDGRQVAFNSDRAGDMNIWLHALQGGAERALTKGPGGDFQPQWSPDGRTIVFFSSRGGSADIWSVDVASGSLTQLTRDAATDANPCFSPDGSQIAYQSDEGGRLEVWIMQSDGSAPRALTRSGVLGHFLRFTKRRRRRGVPGGGRRRQAAERARRGRRAGAVRRGRGRQPHLVHARLLAGRRRRSATRCCGRRRSRAASERGSSPSTTRATASTIPCCLPTRRFVLFDVFRPMGGDVWWLEGLAEGPAR